MRLEPRTVNGIRQNPESSWNHPSLTDPNEAPGRRAAAGPTRMPESTAVDCKWGFLCENSIQLQIEGSRIFGNSFVPEEFLPKEPRDLWDSPKLVVLTILPRHSSMPTCKVHNRDVPLLRQSSKSRPQNSPSEVVPQKG